MKMSTICKMLDSNRFVEAIREAYSAVARILHNHHLQARFHRLREGDPLRDCLVRDRCDMWKHVQAKLVEVLSLTMDSCIVNLNCLQLFDFMSLSNMMEEIGREFSGSDTAAS